MTKEELIKQTERIIQSASNNAHGGLAQAKEFLRTYAGNNNNFLKSLEEIDGRLFLKGDILRGVTVSILKSFQEYVENNLLRSISLEREIQIETVSDYLSQAEELLNSNEVHSAAPAVLIGASLEEFLRNWLEEEGADLIQIKNSLDGYATELKRLGKINKQDSKDITSWGGTRNSAAHGHWDEVGDRKRIKLMLEGVNLFIRKHSKIQPQP